MSIIEITETDSRACTPSVHDERGEPGRCVIANQIKEQYHWAKHVSVGTSTIRVYDYRCEHNPEGLVGRCDDDNCNGGRRLTWATPLPWSRAIKDFDRGGNPEFPALTLDINSAEASSVSLNGLERSHNRTKARQYRRQIQSGEREVTKTPARQLARAKQNRRKG